MSHRTTCKTPGRPKAPNAWLHTWAKGQKPAARERFPELFRPSARERREAARLAAAELGS